MIVLHLLKIMSMAIAGTQQIVSGGTESQDFLLALILLSFKNKFTATN